MGLIKDDNTDTAYMLLARHETVKYFVGKSLLKMFLKILKMFLKILKTFFENT